MKQVIIVNGSLKLPKGKLAAQVAHAAVASFLDADATAQRQWLNSGMPKIVLKAATEIELIDIQQQAVACNLPAHLIRDAGKTVVEAGTITCLGLGPAEPAKIDALTTHLKLL